VLGATSTRSRSASRAIRSASRVATTPAFSPAASIRRTSGTLMVSLTRNSLALILLSLQITEVQPGGWFKRADNTMKTGESSIKRPGLDEFSPDLFISKLVHNSLDLLVIRSLARSINSASGILSARDPSRTRSETCPALVSFSPTTSM